MGPTDFESVGRTTRQVPWVVCVLILTACFGRTEQSGHDELCPIGKESCACTVGGACDSPLVCLSGFCVDAGGDGDGDTVGSGDGDGDLVGGGDSAGDGDGDGDGDDVAPGDGDGDSAGDGDGDGDGAACVDPAADSDADGLTDCEEDADGDPWTDRGAFNGMHVRLAVQCSGLGSCMENDTLAKVDACMSVAITEELDQSAGWDWDDLPDSSCDAGYGFEPPWTQCSAIWQADWQGRIKLAQAGYHCFGVMGNGSEACTSLFFDAETLGIQSGGEGCFDMPAGTYPIRWHYTMDNGSSSGMHVNYCHGGASPCAPDAALPSRMLRPE